MDPLKKIRELPLETKKLIFWILMVTLAITLFGVWGKLSLQKIRNLQAEQGFQQIKWPDLKDELESISEMRNEILEKMKP